MITNPQWAPPPARRVYRKGCMPMQNKKIRGLTAAILMAALLTAAGCGSQAASSSAASAVSDTAVSASSEANVVETVVGDDLFSDRDLNQSPDLTDATELSLSSGQDLTITEEGIYHITGSAQNASIIVEAPDDAKVQLVLDNVTLANESAPAIYVKTADKVFVTSMNDNSLSVTGTFTADGDTNTDAVIFSKSDLTLNGTGTLTIESAQSHGVAAKDDLTITGGTYNVTAASDAFQAHDSIAIADGSFTINSGKDAFQAKYDDDDTVGFIYVRDGSFNITAGDDGLQATTTNTIDGGTFTINAVEAIEGTQIVINGGSFDITASDDGINAAQKTSTLSPSITINGGDFTINMAQGDTDALDANGDLTINGGTFNITAQSAFDYDGTGTLNGGTLTVNGETWTELTQTGPGSGGPGGGRGGMGGGPGDGDGRGGHGHGDRPDGPPPDRLESDDSNSQQS